MIIPRTVAPALVGAHDALVRVNSSQSSSVPPLLIPLCKYGNSRGSATQRDTRSAAPKACTRGCDVNHCAAESPGTGQGVVTLMVSRQLLGRAYSRVPATRPASSSGSSGPRGSTPRRLSLHYPKRPPRIPLLHCCYYLFIGGALSLWTGTYPDVHDSGSGAPLRVYQSPAAPAGSLHPPRQEIMLQTQRACRHVHFPTEEPTAWCFGTGGASESICGGRETEAQTGEGIPQDPTSH